MFDRIVFGGEPLDGLIGFEPLFELPEAIRAKPTLQCIYRIRGVFHEKSLVTGLRRIKFSSAFIAVLNHATELSLMKRKSEDI